MEDLASDCKPNFMSAEIEVLIEEAKLKESILFGKYSGRSAAVFHQAAWETIAKKTNCCEDGKERESRAEKATNALFGGKTNAVVLSAARRKTCGGPIDAADRTTLDECILNVVGEHANKVFPWALTGQLHF